MLTTKFVTGNFVSPSELSHRSNQTVVLSSRQLGWNGILVEQCQSSSNSSFEMELPAISDHLAQLTVGKTRLFDPKTGQSPV
jgi:AraC family transcriptional regulator